MRYTLSLRICARMLVCVLLFAVLALPALPAQAALDGDDIGSEAYCSRFTSDHWDTSGPAGKLLSNSSSGICLDICEKGAGLRATLFTYDGRTPCNALQMVLENRSACTEMTVHVVYLDGSEETVAVRLQASSERTAYYAYLSEVDGIEHVQVTFNGVSDGQIVLYSASRVSFYHGMTEDARHGSIKDCYYDPATATVVLTGQLASDALVAYRGGTLSLIKLAPDDDILELMNNERALGVRVMQKQPAGNRFSFTVDADSFTTYSSRYAVVLSDVDGNRVLLCEPCYPVLRCEQAKPVPDGYKGIYVADPDAAGDCYPDMLLVDVYLDELLQQSGGETETYAFDETYYTFNRAYRDRLQRKIAPHKGVGTQVCLRILVRANQAGYSLPFTCDAPDVSTPPEYLAVCLTTRDEHHAYAAALTYLLSGIVAECGEIDGVILGCGLDRSLQYHYAGMIPLREYLETVVDTLVQTHNTVRAVCPGAQIYLPVTDTVYPDYYTSYDLDGIYATPMLLDGICRMLDDLGNGDVCLRLLLEKSGVPFDQTVEVVQTGSEADTVETKHGFTTTGSESEPSIKSLLAPLASYESMADRGAVLWTPPAQCDALALRLSYIYLYYSLQDGSVDTFFAGFDPTHLSDITPLVARIDTEEASAVTDFALPYFDIRPEDGFAALVKDTSVDRRSQLYLADLVQGDRSAYAGRYLYWNFTAAVGTLQWSPGAGCSALSADGGSHYGRALLAQMDGAGGKLFYTFARPEDFSLCDALSFSAALTDGQGTPVPAHLTVTLYGDGWRTEATGEFASEGVTDLDLTGLALQAAEKCTAIAIEARPLSEEHERLQLYLLQIEGRSKSMDDDALRTQILAHKTQSADEDNGEKPSLTVYPVLLMTSLLLIVATGAVVCLRASGRRSRRRDGAPLQ